MSKSKLVWSKLHRIVRKRFYREFTESAYAPYPLKKKLQFLSELEDFVDHNITFRFLERVFMGRSKDLEKTIRFMHLHLLYRQSTFISLNIS